MKTILLRQDTTESIGFTRKFAEKLLISCFDLTDMFLD